MSRHVEGRRELMYDPPAGDATRQVEQLFENHPQRRYGSTDPKTRVHGKRDTRRLPVIVTAP